MKLGFDTWLMFDCNILLYSPFRPSFYDVNAISLFDILPISYFNITFSPFALYSYKSQYYGEHFSFCAEFVLLNYFMFKPFLLNTYYNDFTLFFSLSFVTINFSSLYWNFTKISSNSLSLTSKVLPWTFLLVVLN